MHEFHTFNQMDAPEIDAYIDNLTQRLVNIDGLRTHRAGHTTPHPDFT